MHYRNYKPGQAFITKKGLTERIPIFKDHATPVVFVNFVRDTK